MVQVKSIINEFIIYILGFSMSLLLKEIGCNFKVQQCRCRLKSKEKTDKTNANVVSATVQATSVHWF
jgi:hypothetical protein